MPAIYRKYDTPDRLDPDWEERWKGEDQGLITCWEVGRKLRLSNPELSELALQGNLPMLDWKGGVEKGIKLKSKLGTLNYLAQWQALRGEDLNIDTEKEYTLTCTDTGVNVLFRNHNS